MRRLNLCCLLIAFLTIASIGCAGSSIPTAPSDISQPQQAAVSDNQGRELWGMWELYYDGNTLSVTNVTERYVSLTHFNVKQFLKPPYCDDCLLISNIVDDQVNKILSVDVTIKNPFQIEGADPRGIFMSKVAVVSLANADAYTDLWNEYNGEINGFKLFGKDKINGVFGGDDQATETFEINYNWTPFFLSTAIDAIYPADSLREPYAIENQEIEGALDINGNVARLVSVDVFDRNDDHGVVSVYCEDLGIDTTLSQSGTDINHFIGFVTNSAHAEPGEYTAAINARDSVTGWVLYDYITLTVTSDIGTWVPAIYTLANNSCPRDLAIGFDFMTGDSMCYFPGGSSCDNISKTDTEFTVTNSYFELTEIDPLVPGFSPHPVKRLDVAASGGQVFFVDSEETYSDYFYTGPYSSLMVAIVPDMMGDISYINNGDGDSGRIPPPDPAYRGIDVCDDLQANLYGLWSDSNSTMNPLIYGLIYDYTRHDVMMGGVLPDSVCGDTIGRISRNFGDLKAIQVGGFMFESGDFFILENDGTNSFVEILTFYIDFNLKITTWSTKDSIALGEIDAVDIDILLYNPSYLPNVDSDTIAVLINSPTGPYIRMFDTVDYNEVEIVGSPEEPLMSGAGIALDVDSYIGEIYVANDAEDVLHLEWTL